MVLAFEESYRERIEFEYGSVIEFKRQLYRMISSDEVIMVLVDVVKVAVEQLTFCIQEFIEAWWNIVKDSFQAACSELGRLIEEGVLLVEIKEREPFHLELCNQKCQQNYGKERLNKPTYCRCRSNC